MKYAGIIENDFAAAPGVSVSFFTQGCPHHCKGCHNPETWSFEGGKEFNNLVIDSIVSSLTKNGIHRSLSILGGEPLCPENLRITKKVIDAVLQRVPGTKIYVWTGYEYEFLKQSSDTILQDILSKINVLIDGPYIQELRDTTLLMRGSTNQKIYQLKIDFLKNI